MSLNEFASNYDMLVSDLKKYEKGLAIPDIEILKKVELISGISLNEIKKAHELINENLCFGEGYVTGQKASYFTLERQLPIDNNKIPVLDLFCGIGGFSHGFELTNQFQVVTGIDLLSDRVNTFYNNHPYATALCQDIYNVQPLSLLQNNPSPRVIIGGSPCQGFSSIRPYRSLNDNDKRNNLFEQFAYFVEKLKPEWFVLENVVGLSSHSNGKTLSLVIQAFESIGYTVSAKVLNGAMYGLPQSRERLFIVGNLNSIKFEWPESTHFYTYQSMAKANKYFDTMSIFRNEKQKSLTVMDAIHDLPPIKSGGSANFYLDDVLSTEYERYMRCGIRLLTLHEATLHSEKMLNIIKKSGSNINHVAHLVSSGFSTSYSRLEADRPAATITVNFVHPSSNKCIHPYQDRALTPREGARLQSFEDSFKFSGTRSQTIKQIGNAVPPLLGKLIANAIVNYM